MSSIDPAFIKAFARRNRRSQTAAPSTGPSTAINAQPIAEATGLSSISQTTRNSTSQRSDFLRINPSVDSSVELWTDPSEERLVRVDALQSEPIPAPHAAPKSRASQTNRAHGAAPLSDIATDRLKAEPASVVDLTNRIEKTTETVRNIQASLELLQSTFTTLETFAQPNADLKKFYVDDAMASSATKPSESETQSKSVRFPGDSTKRFEEVVQHRIDAPASVSAASQDAAPKPDGLAQQDRFGLASVPAESLSLRPVWEVDVFEVPTAVADLFFDGPLFQQIAERILQAVNSGLTSMMVTSVHRGEGRSTVAIGMAMAAAAAGLRVALLDADTDDPTLHDDLRLDLEYGWLETVRGGLAIREVAVQAVEDGVTLVPLIPPTAGAAATDFEIVQVLQSLRGKFDLIIVDTPSLESSMSLPVATTVDSALIVRDASRTGADMINKLSYKLREKGVQGIGVVDNFA